MKSRSRIHMLNVAAARLESDRANPKLVLDLRSAATHLSKQKAEGCGYGPEEERRIERQRSLFSMLPSCNATDRLKNAIMQRAYDLLWEGFSTECDTLLEFLPSKDTDKVLSSWESDQSNSGEKTEFYAPGGTKG